MYTLRGITSDELKEVLSDNYYLQNLALEYGLDDRVIFRTSVPNDELCKHLPTFDIFVIHTEHWEISKSLLEALLTGLPVIVNRRDGEQVPEIQGDFVSKVDNNPEEYYQAIKALIENDELRERLGRNAYAHAQKHWSPDKMEAKYVGVYKQTMLPE